MQLVAAAHEAVPAKQLGHMLDSYVAHELQHVRLLTVRRSAGMVLFAAQPAESKASQVRTLPAKSWDPFDKCTYKPCMYLDRGCGARCGTSCRLELACRSGAIHSSLIHDAQMRIDHVC